MGCRGETFAPHRDPKPVCVVGRVGNQIRLPSARKAANVWYQCNRSVPFLLAAAPRDSYFRRRLRRLASMSDGPFVRPTHRESARCKQAASCCSVRLQDRWCRSSLLTGPRQTSTDYVENPGPAPEHKAVIQRLVLTTRCRRILPLQDRLDHVNDPPDHSHMRVVHHTSVIDTRKPHSPTMNH